MRIVRTMIKRHMPSLYNYYKHRERARIINEVEMRKALSEDQYKDILSELYKKRIGRDLNWDALDTYTEKMQWAKLYDKNPQKTECSDKYLVRDWVKERIGEKYLIPLLGVWDSFDKIDFEALPECFVLKTNHGSGTNIIVKDKSKMDLVAMKISFEDWLKTDFGFKTLELHYAGIRPLILAEKYIETISGDLQDYKFLCFNGEPAYCWVDKGRYSKHTRDIYDLDWKLQPWTQGGVPNSANGCEKPKNFHKMIEVAKELSKGFSHVRVDLYNVEGVIFFGEMTFTNGGGLDKIEPLEFDYHLGSLWTIDVNSANGLIEKD